jgi:hypothetical protein
VAERVGHWFNRRYGTARRDVCLLRTETGWQVLGRQGGADGPEVTHYFDREDEAAPAVMSIPVWSRDADDGRPVAGQVDDLGQHPNPAATSVTSAPARRADTRTCTLANWKHRTCWPRTRK